MEEFFGRLSTSMRWFLGTIVAIIMFFFWTIIDPQGSTTIINEFKEFIQSLFGSVLTLIVVIVGFRIMLGHRPWWLGGGRRNNGHH